MKNYDVVIVGGGPAGMGAGIECAKTGAKTLIIERENRLGGILNQCIHNGFGLHYFKEELTGPEYAHRFEELLKDTNVDVSLNTFVTKIDNKDIYEMSNDNLAIFRRRQIGLVYQFYNLIPVLNIEENIKLPLQLDNREPKKEDMENMLKMLGLTSRRLHLPNELSGGQQQRTSIGRALITNPAIILADEPTGNLDSKASEEIMDILKISNEKYKQTIIMITHDLELAKEADRIIKLEDGKIVKEV